MDKLRSKRILFIYPSLWRYGGGTLAFQNQVKYFANKGSLTFTFYFEGDDSIEIPGMKERIKHNIRDNRLSKYFFNYSMFKQLIRIYKQFKPTDIYFHGLDSQFFTLALFMVLVKTNGTKIINIIHAESYNCMNSMHTYKDSLEECGGSPGLKCIYHHCETIYSFLSKFIYLKLRNAILNRYVDFFAASNNYLMGQLHKIGFKNVIYLPLIMDHLGAHDKVFIANKEYTNTMVFVGHLSWHKGPQYLPSIVKELTNYLSNFRLVIIGDGPLKKNIEEEINKLSLNKHIKMLGALPNDQTIAIMKNASLCVAPTFYENMSLTIFEALYFGVPVITTDRGGNSDLIVSGYNGYFVDFTDKNGVVNILSAILKDKDKLNILRNNARKSVEKYCNETVFNYYLAL
jgi:glycosyltransferase involved in cell wall biosynthesis